MTWSLDRSHASLLFIHNAGLGDAIMVSPALSTLKKHLPGWKLCVLARANAIGYLSTLPFVDKVLPFVSEKWLARRPWGAPVIGLLYADLLRQLRRQQFQAVIQWRGQLIDTVASFVSGAPLRVAAVSGLIRKSRLPVERVAFLVTHLVSIDDERVHIVQYFMQIATEMIRLISGAAPADLCWDLHVPVEQREREVVARLLSAHGLRDDAELVAISVGSRTKMNFWSPDRFAAVADYIQEYLGARLVLTGVRSQIPIERMIVSHMRTVPICTCGELTLGALAALFERCRLVVTLNSASMHVASATKTPVVALFGRDGAAFTPWRTEHIVITKNPYYPKRHPDPRQWPALVELIQPEEVITAVTKLWDGVHAPKRVSPHAAHSHL